MNLPYVWDGALRNRDADTVYHDPDRESVSVLDLRGIDPDIDPDNGVFRDRPAAGLIDTLDRHFGPGQEPAIC